MRSGVNAVEREWNGAAMALRGSGMKRSGNERNRSRCVYSVPVTPLLLSEQSARWLCGQSESLLAPGAGGHGFGVLAPVHPRAAVAGSLAVGGSSQISSCWTAGGSRPLAGWPISASFAARGGSRRQFVRRYIFFGFLKPLFEVSYNGYQYTRWLRRNFLRHQLSFNYYEKHNPYKHAKTYPFNP